MKVYQKLASEFIGYQNCINSNNETWINSHKDVITSIIKKLPHGSGIDGETKFSFVKSTRNSLVIDSEYHTMNDNGYYDGWINFSIIIKPDWYGIDISIRGNFGKHQDLKEYLVETFGYALELDY